MICTMYERPKEMMIGYDMKIGTQRKKVREGDQGYYW